jgi:hypothetical protein
LNIQSVFSRLKARMSAYPATWVADTKKMCKLVGEFDTGAPPASDAANVAIVLIPWMGTAVPWFCLVMGLFLARRGSRVTFILDDMPFAGDTRSSAMQARCIKKVLQVMNNRFTTVTLSDHRVDVSLDAEAAASIDRLAALNAIWALRGEMIQPKRARLARRAARQLRKSYGAIRDVVTEGDFDMMFIPGGVWGSSGVWMDQARRIGSRVSSFDSGGYGTLLLAVNGIACQLQDIPRAFAELKTDIQVDSHRALVTRTAMDEMNKRRAGTDKFSSQVKGSNAVYSEYAGGILIALNSSWDSAALGMHDVFAGSAEWIVATVRYLLDNTTVPVIVRQHPAERLDIARTSDDYADLLAKNFGTHERLHFIAAGQAINSYDLMEQVAAVITHTSTIGLEAAANGKPVITASRAYYAGLGFVWKAHTEQDYEGFLADAAAGRLQVTPAMAADALACYYLTQCCNWVYTPFTVPDFDTWINTGIVDLIAQESVQRVVQAVDQNIPAAILNHRARVAQELPEHA